MRFASFREGSRFFKQNFGRSFPPPSKIEKNVSSNQPWTANHQPNLKALQPAMILQGNSLINQGIMVLHQNYTHQKQGFTPRKFNSEFTPEKCWLEDYLPIGKVTFQGRTVKLREGKKALLRDNGKPQITHFNGKWNRKKLLWWWNVYYYLGFEEIRTGQITPNNTS